MSIDSVLKGRVMVNHEAIPKTRVRIDRVEKWVYCSLPVYMIFSPRHREPIYLDILPLWVEPVHQLH
jgi:hypothetical protein